MSRGRHVRALEAADAFAAETYRVPGDASGRRSGLVGEIRRSAVRSGGALLAVAASSPGGRVERRLLERARTGLVESRYYLYLARRLGELGLDHYRGLTSRQGTALRELEALLGPRGEPPGVHGR